MLDYFDSFMIGLTATPDKRTFGFFNQNVVSEYTHEQAIIDKVNVGYDVFVIEKEISKKGGAIAFGEYVDKRDKLTHKTRWEQLDEEISYKPTELDKAVVNPSTIRMSFSQRLAGYEGIVCGLLAIYAACGQLLHDAFGKKVIPY